MISAHADPAREPASDSPVHVPEFTEPKPILRKDATSPPLEKPSNEEDGRLTGDWGGRRKSWAEKGLDFNFVYKYEYNQVMSGGRERAIRTLHNLDLKASVDLDKLAGIHGLSFYLYGLGNYGDDPSRTVGDIQGTSNIETPANTMRLYEAWVQQVGFEDRVSLLAGLHDLNSEFYVTETSTLFFNASFGVGRELSQTGANGPSIFPVTAPSVRLRVEPTRDFYFQTAAFNAVAGNPDYPTGTHVRVSPNDGALIVTEAAFLRGLHEGSGLNHGKYGIGYWFYSIPVSRYDQPGAESVNSGFYLLADQAFPNDTSVFARTGYASVSTNKVACNWSLGVVKKGLIPGRESDKIGLAITQAVASDPYRASEEAAGNSLGKNETTAELNYRIELPSGLVLQPDLQYVWNPSFSSQIDNATVLAVRLEVNF